MALCWALGRCPPRPRRWCRRGWRQHSSRTLLWQVRHSRRTLLWQGRHWRRALIWQVRHWSMLHPWSQRPRCPSSRHRPNCNHCDHRTPNCSHRNHRSTARPRSMPRLMVALAILGTVRLRSMVALKRLTSARTCPTQRPTPSQTGLLIHSPRRPRKRRAASSRTESLSRRPRHVPGRPARHVAGRPARHRQPRSRCPRALSRARRCRSPRPRRPYRRQPSSRPHLVGLQAGPLPCLRTLNTTLPLRRLRRRSVVLSCHQRIRRSPSCRALH